MSATFSPGLLRPSTQSVEYCMRVPYDILFLPGGQFVGMAASGLLYIPTEVPVNLIVSRCMPLFSDLEPFLIGANGEVYDSHSCPANNGVFRSYIMLLGIVSCRESRILDAHYPPSN